jgi:hypothetical protein
MMQDLHYDLARQQEHGRGPHTGVHSEPKGHSLGHESLHDSHQRY